MLHYVTLFFEGFGIGAVPALLFFLVVSASRAFFDCVEISTD